MRRRGTLWGLLGCLLLLVSSISGNAHAEDALHSPHSLSAVAEYLPMLGAWERAEYGVWSDEKSNIGAMLSYAYRLTESVSIGVGATIRGIPLVRTDKTANAFSLPLLLTYDPSLSSRVRLLMSVGFGYEHAWGNTDGWSKSWGADGPEAMAALGIAVRASSKLEGLVTVGARVGVVDIDGFDDWLRDYHRVYTWAVPLGVGVRYSL